MRTLKYRGAGEFHAEIIAASAYNFRISAAHACNENSLNLFATVSIVPPSPFYFIFFHCSLMLIRRFLSRFVEDAFFYFSFFLFFLFLCTMLKHLSAFYVQQILKVSIQAIKKKNMHAYVCATRTGCPSSFSLSFSRARIPRSGGRRKRHINGLLPSRNRNGDRFLLRWNVEDQFFESPNFVEFCILLKTWKQSVGKTEWLPIYFISNVQFFLDFSRKHSSFTVLTIFHCHCYNYALFTITTFNFR